MEIFSYPPGTAGGYQECKCIFKHRVEYIILEIILPNSEKANLIHLPGMQKQVPLKHFGLPLNNAKWVKPLIASSWMAPGEMSKARSPGRTIC
jgi:hypothetical protein